MIVRAELWHRKIIIHIRSAIRWSFFELSEVPGHPHLLLSLQPDDVHSLDLSAVLRLGKLNRFDVERCEVERSRLTMTFLR